MALIGRTCQHFSIQLYFCCNISIRYLTVLMLNQICWTSLSAKLVDAFLEFKDIYLMLSFLAHYPLSGCWPIDSVCWNYDWAKELVKVFACRIRILEKNVHSGHCPLPEWLIALFLNLSCGDEARHPNQIFNKDVLLRDAVIIARLFLCTWYLTLCTLYWWASRHYIW